MVKIKQKIKQMWGDRNYFLEKNDKKNLRLCNAFALFKKINGKKKTK